jgi:hypothetical protein
MVARTRAQVRAAQSARADTATNENTTAGDNSRLRDTAAGDMPGETPIRYEKDETNVKEAKLQQQRAIQSQPAGEAAIVEDDHRVNNPNDATSGATKSDGTQTAQSKLLAGAPGTIPGTGSGLPIRHHTRHLSERERRTGSHKVLRGMSESEGTLKILDNLPVNSILERAGHGWDIRIAVPNAIAKLHGSGETLADAFESIGTQLIPTDPAPENEQPQQETPQVELSDGTTVQDPKLRGQQATDEDEDAPRSRAKKTSARKSSAKKRSRSGKKSAKR